MMICRRPLKSLALLFAGGLASAFLAITPAANAQSPPNNVIPEDVTNAIGRMGKTLQANDFSFQADTFRAYAGPNGELLHIAHQTKIVVRRPDRLSVDATGDDGATKMLYDGKSLVIYAVNRKQYASIPVPNSIEKMLDVAENRLGVDMPLSDFVGEDPAKTFLNGVTSGGQVGTAMIDGVACRHFFFTQPPDLELEIWLEDNDRALPRRLVVTYTSLPGRPSFIALLSKWDFSAHHPDADFVFKAPEGVKQVELAASTSGSPPPAAK